MINYSRLSLIPYIGTDRLLVDIKATYNQSINQTLLKCTTQNGARTAHTIGHVVGSWVLHALTAVYCTNEQRVPLNTPK